MCRKDTKRMVRKNTQDKVERALQKVRKRLNVSKGEET